MKQIILFSLLFSSMDAFSQEALKLRPDPLEVVTGRYKDAYLKIVYSRPQKKGREIFGKLVPFGTVWRTGANEATELTVTRDIKLNGNDLKAGTYSVFTIPQKDTWTVIINSELGLMGAYNYNAKMDILRLEIPAEELKELVYEAFTIDINQKNDKAEIVMAWDKTKIVVPVQFLEPKL